MSDARKLGEAGMQNVMRAEWKRQYRAALLRHVPQGFEGIAEQYRNIVTAAGLGKPHHHNAWGANWNSLLRTTDWLVDTGRTDQMQDERSHGRGHNKVYRFDPPSFEAHEENGNEYD